MEYIELSVEDVMRLILSKSKNGKVKVAVNDLQENNDSIFVIKTIGECKHIIEDAETIASLCDDFMHQIKCYSEEQDIFNIKPIGLESILLLPGGNKSWER